MIDHDERGRRIELARALADVVGSVSDVRDVNHRDALRHDQIAEAVRRICRTEGRQPFTTAQVDCLVQIGFQLALLIDERSQPKKGAWAHLKQAWLEARLIERVAVFVTLLVGLPGAALALFELFATSLAYLP